MPHSLFRWLYIFCSWLIFSTATVSAQRLAECCDWPPVFQRQFGNPEVVVKEGGSKCRKVTYIRPLKKVIVKVPSSTSRKAAVKLATDYFLVKIWEDFLSPDALTASEMEMNMTELVELSWAQFYHIGTTHLAGNCTGNCLYDGWWSVRMGQPLTVSSRKLLSMNSVVWAEGKGNQFGHFSIAVRQRGGLPDGDYIIDFRGIWDLDRRSGVKDLFSDELELIAIRENYYDWLSTQVRYRHCDVTSTFVAVHEEQLRLLENYSRKVHHAGEYRFAKSNCATLGVQVLNRLLPLDQRIPRENGFFDLPTQKIKLATKVFGGAVCVVDFPSETLKIGREISHRNQSLPAEPTRKSSGGFCKLAGLSALN